MNIRKLVIKDVRCFSGRHELVIRPITFLVGENSTGKSTVLGCLHTLYDFIRGKNAGLDFNTQPFEMGAFTDIVRRANPRKTEFEIGLDIQNQKSTEPVEYTLGIGTKERSSEPVIVEQRIRYENGEVSFVENSELLDESDPQTGLYDNFKLVKSTEMNGISKTKLAIEKNRLESAVLAMLSPFSSIRYLAREMESVYLSVEQERPISPKRNQTRNNFHMELLHVFKEYLAGYPKNERWSPAEVCSFAPIRSKPQRTYDPIREDVSPFGSDLPMTLVNMTSSDKERWQQLRDRLSDFGRQSGLFNGVFVRRFGKSPGDPFQLQVKVNGPRVNMVDVGYGVSQILPILVRVLNGSRSTMFLMQQPEIHLHPKGQAALTSLLIETLNREKNAYVIETHSDTLVNRARIEIMNGVISPEDVSLVYLEPVGNGVKVHNIQFDNQANLIGAPQGYRDFFINESDRLLGFTN